MYDSNEYSSVITEQGDLGLGVLPIHESVNKQKTKKSENEEKQANKQKK